MIISAEEMSVRKFGKLRMKNSKAILPGSNKKETWICDCGKETLASPYNVTSGFTSSCGRCNEISAEEMAVRKFGKLRMKFPKVILPGSEKKEVWICDCGKENTSEIYKVVTRKNSSCGRCNEISAEEMKIRKFGKLRMKDPKAILPGSTKKETWICDCGKEKLIRIDHIVLDGTISCGRCNEISQEEMSVRKFGKLRMKFPKSVLPGSNKKEIWVCDCGKEKEIKISRVIQSNGTTSCGRCNEIPAEEMSVRKFGKLRMKFPKAILPNSTRKEVWICDCGKEITITVGYVISGDTKSCGQCKNFIDDWYLKNKDQIRSLKCPIKPEDFPSGGPIPLEDIITSHGKYEFKCAVCGNTYYPRLHDIKLNNGGLTCGCSFNKVSFAQKEISSFIESLGIPTELEYEVNGLSYDIFVPSANLLIEYNGLRWHSFEKSKLRDFRKYKTAINYSYLMIFEDEWLYYQDKVKNLLKNKLIKSNPISLRPQKCEIKIVSSDLANPFYDSFHYIGRCNAKVHYGVFYQNHSIACMSFSHPTRQTSKYNFELIRMASDPAYRVHGIWSKLLHLFISEYSPSSIVSFSDNRLFSGGVYEKIGFHLDGEIRPDYYWVKGNRRFHKSGLRKTKEERLTGLTETVLREAQGYRKIWDLGKKRWVWCFNY